MTKETGFTISNIAIAEQEKISKNVDQEILKAERLRALIFAIFIFFLAVVFSIGTNPSFHLMDINEKIPHLTVALVLLGFSGFEFFIWYTMGRFLHANKKIPVPWHYLIAFVEIGLPTTLIFISSHVVFVYALFLPPIFLYFLIIALSGLKLDFFICVFTSATAAFEYVFLAWHITNSTDIPDNMHGADLIYPFFPHLIKGVMLLATGIITGIVTSKLKKMFLKSFQSISENNHIMNIFGQHVSPAVMEKLLHQKNATEGEVQNVCVMFLDIRNFTTFSESRTPQEVVAYLNSLFDFMIEIINRNQGIINKFLGDGFMAVFGAPFSDGFDSRNAVNASKEIIKKLQEEIKAGNILPTTVGIGLHTGNAVTGNIGSSQRKEYTIIGDVVNLASRIESLNKQFNTKFLISDRVKEALGDAGNDAISLGKVTVKGRAEPVEIYKLA